MADNTVNSDSQQTVSEMCEFDKGTILSSIEDFQSEIDDESELRDVSNFLNLQCKNDS